MDEGWSEKARRFAALHRPGDPLILFNVWDVGSARVVAEPGAGAKAIATGSFSVAGAQGYADGEAMPLDRVLENARRIVEAVKLPVTVDFEGAYASDPRAAAENVLALVQTGAVGCNFEDRIVGGEGLYDLVDQARRVGTIAARVPRDFFLNARTDLFLQAAPKDHEGLIEAALERAVTYAAAGADGFFVPGLVDEPLIARICERSPLPVNVMIWFGTPPLRRLAELGVARISHAGGPWRIAMEALGQAARRAHRMEDRDG